MTGRDRTWLQGFLHLGARAERDGIPPGDVERQEDTVLRARTLLDDQPGVVLADEVGMGKTFEALGVAACFRHENPKSRIVVITPGPDLNAKWAAEFPRFREMYDFGDDVEPVTKLADFALKVREHPLVVAPVSMFQSGRASDERAYLLSLFGRWKELHGKTVNALIDRVCPRSERMDTGRTKFLGAFGREDLSDRKLAKAFRRGRRDGPPGVDDLWESGGLEAFNSQRAAHLALHRARFSLINQLMPRIDLLIVDEAHKLKNPGSLRTQGMRSVFHRKFEKALFLTATPFQLDVVELKEIFALFGAARSAPDDLSAQVDMLLAAIRDYQQQYDDFQNAWAMLDPEVAAQFRVRYDAGQAAPEGLEEPSLKLVAQQIENLKRLKNGTIEPGFRQWMVRSLREEKRLYRQHLRREVRPEGAGAMPFLLYERLIAELFRRRHATHKAAAEINMVSSYAAAKGGAVLAGGNGIPPEAEQYRALLSKVLDDMDGDAYAHPKIRRALSDAIEAADRGEKTLIFCSRVATLRQMKDELDAIWSDRLLEHWRRVFPGITAEEAGLARGETATQGRHMRLQARFRKPQDALYLALREPYLRTVAPIADWTLANLDQVRNLANEILGSVRVGKTSAERLDYQIAKRCVEQAAVRCWMEQHPGRDLSAHTENLCDARYITLGLDLLEDEYEGDAPGDQQPTWTISEDAARMVVGPPGSLWEHLSDTMMRLEVAVRVGVVEQLGRYLTFQQVPFLPALLGEAADAGLSIDPVESAAMLKFLPRFWQTTTGRAWVVRFREFLEYFVHRDQHQQKAILNGPLQQIRFSRHTGESDSRERLREAFNTPLFPMVLIANEVMQEGLDLHKHCRRIVHHDLVWNPAQLEQRIGRIDRLGSLTNRLRKAGSDSTLDVLYPLIRGTIDERLFRTVKDREKWLEFLLGAPLETEVNDLGVQTHRLPEKLASDLVVDLSPHSVTEPGEGAARRPNC